MSKKKIFVTFYRLSAKESSKDWRSEVEVLRDNFAELEKEFAERERQIKFLNKNLVYFKDLVSKQKEQIDSLNKQVVEQNEAINDLYSDNETLRKCKEQLEK